MKIQWKTCFRIGFSILLVYLCIHYIENVQELLLKGIGAAAPIAIGCAIAYVVNILMVFYEKHFFPAVEKNIAKKLKRIGCMIAAYISLVAIIALVVSLVIPELVECIKLVLDQIPKASGIILENIKDDKLIPKKVLGELSNFDWQEKIGELVNMAISYFGNVMNMLVTVVTKVFSGVVTAFLSIIFSIYLLVSKDSLKVNFNKLMDSYMKKDFCKKVRYVVSVLDESFHNFIVGQTAEAVILGILCTLGMLALRLPYATMIGALVAFSALIPVVGAFMGAAVGAFMIAMSNPFDAVVFIIFIIVLQQIEGNFIYPKVVGSSIGLPAVWVLAAVTVGGGILGVLGMLIGVPVAATIYKIVSHDVSNKMAVAVEGEAEEDTELKSEEA